MDSESHSQLGDEIRRRMIADQVLLERLRQEIRPLAGNVRRIQPRSTTAISLAGTDGGNNHLRFDPFLVQLVRVVDSSNNQYWLEAITPTTSVSELSAKQFDEMGTPKTALGHMMAYLGVRLLSELSPMIRPNEDDRP